MVPQSYLVVFILGVGLAADPTATVIGATVATLGHFSAGKQYIYVTKLKSSVVRKL